MRLQIEGPKRGGPEEGNKARSTQQEEGRPVGKPGKERFLRVIGVIGRKR